MKSHNYLLRQLLRALNLQSNSLSPPLLNLLEQEAWCRENGYKQVRKYRGGYFTIGGSTLLKGGVAVTVYDEVPVIENQLLIDIHTDVPIIFEAQKEFDILFIIF